MHPSSRFGRPLPTTEEELLEEQRAFLERKETPAAKALRKEKRTNDEDDDEKEEEEEEEEEEETNASNNMNNVEKPFVVEEASLKIVERDTSTVIPTPPTKRDDGSETRGFPKAEHRSKEGGGGNGDDNDPKILSKFARRRAEMRGRRFWTCTNRM